MYQTVRFINKNGVMDASDPMKIALPSVAAEYISAALIRGDAVIIRGPVSSGKTWLFRQVCEKRAKEYRNDVAFDTSAFWHGLGGSKKDRQAWISRDPGDHTGYKYDPKLVPTMIRLTSMVVSGAKKSPLILAGGFARLNQLDKTIDEIWKAQANRAVVVVDCTEELQCDYASPEVVAMGWKNFEWLDPDFVSGTQA